MTEGWRKLHNEELHNLYYSSIFRMRKAGRMRWPEQVACLEKKLNACRMVMGRPERKRL
jgi:hypothetical protein